jgi:hypothetical protein
MDIEQITVTPARDGRWAVKHGDGFLGVAGGEQDAIGVGRELVEWLSAQGRPAELRIERSFSPRR